ncbi:unnamed protein product [Caenorhabditis auriculariae]|uniref:Uncharacterized protein n=1 Tax=Caenorhabditis auriculariae TaxID=2777116 RepID=A0A8S1HH43_9PELO|nr:unnamed protein product [Caenorhabditis auriculariae]
MLNAFSAESCCQRPIYAYENGDAVPPECKPTDRCTEASIFADRARSGEAVQMFLMSLKKSNTITLIGNTTTYNLDILEEVIHKGLGPAITLQNVVLSRGSFKKLKTIKVDDVSIYCDGTTDLIKIEGSIPQPILDRLQKVKNETLEACKSLTTTQPSVLVATQEACVPNSNLQKVVENVEKECSNNEAPPGIQTAEESAPEAQKDRKIAGVDLSIRVVCRFAIMSLIKRRRRVEHLASLV